MLEAHALRTFVAASLVAAGCASPAAPAVPVAPAAPAAPAAPPRAPAATPDAPSGAAAQRDAELARQAAAFVDAFTNEEAALTPDGKRVVFVSDRDGLPQLYVADVARPSAAPRRVVETTERMADPYVTRDGRSIVFLSDAGANELWSVFRVGLDGKGLVELTPGEQLERDHAFIPDAAPDTMLFSARALDSSRTTIYAASTVTPGPGRPLYTDELPSTLVAVSRDGKILIVKQAPSRSENYLVRVDAATGKATRLYPAEGRPHASMSVIALSADDRRIYLATDDGGEQTVVYALDVATGKQLAKHAVQPAYAAVRGISVARQGGLVAISMIAGNHSEIRLLDARTLTPKQTIAMPLGQGGAGAFSADGKLLPIEWSTPRAPTDLFAYRVATGVVEPLRAEARPTLAAMPELEATSVDLPAFDGGKIPTNVYLPRGEQAKRHPVVVVYHGGPSGISMIRWSTTTAFFASLGYAVVEPNVRGSAGYGRAFLAGDDGPKRVDAFRDVETSARWVAEQPWADRDRLVVYGASYGGYTTLIALSRWPDLWRAGVNLYGVGDLNAFMAITTGQIRQVFLVEFGDPDKDAALLARLSPLTDADKIVDPTFVYAGANDPYVPRVEADRIVAALRPRVPIEYMVADNEGHSLSRRDNQLAFYSRCARFLEGHLR